MPSQATIAPVVVSTDMLPPRERFDAWRETFALRLVRVDATTPDRAAFRAAVAMLPLGRLPLVTVDVGAVGLWRTRELARDGDDDIALAICAKGSARLRFGDRLLTIHPGEAALVPSNCVGGLETDSQTRSVSLRLSRALIRELLGQRDLPVLRVIPRDDPALLLLSTYACGIAANGAPLPVATAELAGRQLCELAAHLLDPTADIVRAERFGGVKAARLQAILGGIDRNLADPTLSAARLGFALGLSERYVHHLLAEAGFSFTQLVRQKRLDRARQMLQERRATPRRIVDIAYAVGFGDLSHFNRAFRQHFGCTPSDVRRGR